MSYRYKAFISYSHEDSRWALWLHNALERYRTPRQLVGVRTALGPVPPRLSPIFRDREELASSADLSSRLTEALEASENLILLCSPSAARSRWANQEVEAFQRMGRADRIHCVIVDGSPTAEGDPEDCFPPAVRHRFDESGRQLPGSAEPLAADVRSEADGKSLALQKVIAGILGLELDRLRQRESQRRHRRLLALVGVSLVTAMVMTGLAVTAMLARDEANQRQAQAEGILGYMVGDLRTSLDPLGRLDLLEKLGEQALDYFAAIDVSRLSDEELLRQAQVITQLGEIRLAQLKHREALAAFREAHSRAAALVENDPEDGERVFIRAQAEFWIGDVMWRQRDFEQARQWFIAYRDSAVRLVELDASREDWQQELSWGHHNLAVLEVMDMENGSPELAMAGLEESARALQTLYALDNSEEYLDSLIDNLSWRARIALQQGNVEQSLTLYEQCIEQRRELLLRVPDNKRYRSYLVVELSYAAVSAAMLGRGTQAKELAQEAHAINTELREADASNTSLQTHWQGSNLMLARLELLQGQHVSARDRLEISARELELLGSAGIDGVAITDLVMLVHFLRSLLESAAGDLALAEEFSRRSLVVADEMRQGGGLNPETYASVIEVYQWAAHLLRQQGDEIEGLRAAESAGQMIRSAGERQASPIMQKARAIWLYESGNVSAARAAHAALTAKGYDPMMLWSPPGF